MSNTENNT